MRDEGTGLQALVFDWASETARHVGTVVHRGFATELAELGVPPERRDAAVARVLDALARTLADERGRWLLGTHAAGSTSELALSGRLRGEMGALEDFLDEERDRYLTQLERYAMLMRAFGTQPIRLGLHFPLLSAWREWPAGSDEQG